MPKDKNDKFILSDVDYVDTWQKMEECVELGLTKSIGLSNFNSQQIQRVLDVATITPAVNQVLVPVNAGLGYRKNCSLERNEIREYSIS